METTINEYISRELTNGSQALQLENDTSLLDSGILDSLAVLKLVLFLEQQFGLEVASEDLIPENFESVNAICTYIRKQQQAEGAPI